MIADLLLTVLMLAGLSALVWYFGYVHGWTCRGRFDENRREAFDWMHKYAVGEATMQDAPWNKKAR